VDRIALPNLLLQGRREHARPLWIASVDLCAAFDSVDRTALWLLLQSIGIPSELILTRLKTSTQTVSCIRQDGTDWLKPDWFLFGSGVLQGCTVAPSPLLLPVDWLLHRTNHRGFLGAMLGSETFTDLDYADDVALLAEMLEVLLLALGVLEDEARPLGLEVNWQKIKNSLPLSQLLLLHISGNPMDVLESFIYLGSEIHSTGSSEPEVCRQIGLAKSCFNLLNRGVWRFSISLPTEVQLYHTYIQPVLLYGSETWALTRALQDKVDAFDNMCLRRIIRIPYTDDVTNATARLQAGSPPQLSQHIQARRLRFFGHVARIDTRVT